MDYSAGDSLRLIQIPIDLRFPAEPYRTDWRRDYGRIIHSSSFRRLQGKSQLFPGSESDFFRNRLTHSLEVAQIAKSITLKLNHLLKEAGKDYYIEPDIVEVAALAHDLGHPPFGHFGEEVLDKKMRDCGGFEGNAQTLRLLATTEKRHLVMGASLGIDKHGNDKRVGLNLSARSLASILKYDYEIPFREKDRQNTDRPEKGYYRTECNVVDFIKKNICGNEEHAGKFKTIECQIMDIADDIAYSTYDLEDSFKGGFLEPIDLFCASDDVIRAVKRIVNKKLRIRLSDAKVIERIRTVLLSNTLYGPKVEFDEYPVNFSKDELTSFLSMFHQFDLRRSYNISKDIAGNSYYRTRFTSVMVRSAIDCVKISKINKKIPALSKVELEKDKKIDVEILKHFVFESQILSSKIQIDAYRSKEIIGKIFDTLINDTEEGFMFLPKDFKNIYQALKTRKDKKRLVCDFIAGMTDRYALEFYGRLFSENPQTIFKPF